jgi:hypothetical protein
MEDNKDIWVFAEQRNGKIMNVAYEILGAARRLADKKAARYMPHFLGMGLNAFLIVLSNMAQIRYV